MRLAAIALAVLLALIVSSASASTTVSVVYFVPNDQGASIGVQDVEVIMADVQGWYELQGATFAVSGAQVVKGQGDTEYYLQDIWGNVLRELGYWCGTGVHVVIVHPSIGLTGGSACSDGGVAMIEEDVFSDTDFFNFEGIVAHELGHAFGLPHSTCDSVMLCWWGYPDVGLTDSEIVTLRAYFGDETGDDPKTCKPKRGKGKAWGRCK